MARRTIVRTTGNVQTYDFVGVDGTPAVVGPAPQWGDDSDATYAVFYAKSYGEAQNYGQAASAYIAPIDVPAPLNAELWVRFRFQTQVGNWPMDVALQIQANADTLGAAPMGAPTAPTWVEARLSSLSESVSSILTRLRNDGLWLTASSDINAYSGGATEVSFTVYEAQLLVILKGTLHPCRQFPRADGLAASSARRHFPRDESWQASPRWRGGYY